jgi:hypothetical protein
MAGYFRHIESWRLCVGDLRVCRVPFAPVRQPAYSCHPIVWRRLTAAPLAKGAVSMNSDDIYLTPHIFTRHKLHLHALLLEKPSLVQRPRPRPPPAPLPRRTRRPKTRSRPASNRKNSHTRQHRKHTADQRIRRLRTTGLPLLPRIPSPARMAHPRSRSRPARRPTPNHNRAPTTKPAQLAGNVIEPAALEQPAMDSVAGCAAAIA